MTVSEAIEILQDEKSWESDDKKIDALIMAIESLETIQRIKKMFPELTDGDLEMTADCLEELMTYQKIGTIEEFKALKERDVPKKPIRIDECTCPSCGTHNEIIKKRRNTVAFDTVYCWHCGQAIEVKRY